MKWRFCTLRLCSIKYAMTQLAVAEGFLARLSKCIEEIETVSLSIDERH